VFTACYRLEAAGRTWRDRLIEVEGPAVATPDEAAARWAAVVPGSRGMIAGDPVGQVALAAAVGERAQWREAGLLAGTVAVLAAERATSESTPPHALHPLYVRRPDAEVARDRRLAASKDSGR
jgi:tRNA A37 threonylcarbamoyladenosine modification protein TsaB